MSDHINISQIERFDSQWDARLNFEKLQVELNIMTKRFEQAQSNLDAIFRRIARGDEVQLHYRDGEVIRVVALENAAPSGDGVGGGEA